MPAVDLEVLVAAVITRLGATLGAAHVFDGEVNAVMDSDGRAHPYAVVHVSPGNLHSLDLAGIHDVLDWRFQVTAAGGDPSRARRAIVRVRDALTGHDLVVASGVVGRVVEDPDYQPGPLREDRDVAPSRWYAPLQFRLRPTNA